MIKYMHAMWSGSISFGLVNIPVNLYSASRERELSFRLLHKRDRSPIGFVRTCKAEGKKVSNDEIVRGYEIEKGEFILMEDEDFKLANVKKSKSIEIFEFIKEAEIDPMHYEKPYFIEPQKSDKAYAILREALKNTKMAGLAKFVLHRKEQLGIVRASGDMLVLIQVRFQEELREPEGINFPKTQSASEKEVRVATELIKSQAGKFEPGKYHDAYSQDLKNLIEQKARGKRVRVTEVEPVATKPSDLMKMLERSLREPPKRRGPRTQTRAKRVRTR